MCIYCFYISFFFICLYISASHLSLYLLLFSNLFAAILASTNLAQYNKLSLKQLRSFFLVTLYFLFFFILYLQNIPKYEVMRLSTCKNKERKRKEKKVKHEYPFRQNSVLGEHHNKSGLNAVVFHKGLCSFVVETQNFFMHFCHT